MRHVATVAVALLTAGVAWGQPPGGQPPGSGPVGPGGPGFQQQAEKADPQVEAWVKTLTDKMNDPHDAIRDSARAALVAVGGPALPALRTFAGGNDAKAFTARRLVQQIERGAGGIGGFGGLSGPGAFPSQPGPSPTPFPGGPPGGAPSGRPGAETVPGATSPLRGALGELNLDEKQRTQVEKTLEGYATKLRGLLEGARGGKIDREELREATKKLADEATAEVNRILTPDQRATLERLTPRGRSLFPTPFPETPPARADPSTPDRPRQPRPDPDGGR